MFLSLWKENNNHTYRSIYGINIYLLKNVYNSKNVSSTYRWFFFLFLFSVKTNFLQFLKLIEWFLMLILVLEANFLKFFKAILEIAQTTKMIWLFNRCDTCIVIYLRSQFFNAMKCVSLWIGCLNTSYFPSN